MRKLIIAIDGPAASGKSTTAKLISRKLGYLHVDTGAMYRAMALKVIEHGISLTDTESINRLAYGTHISFDYTVSPPRVLLDDRDVTDLLRTREVSQAASTVSALGPVREVMVREQREIGRFGGIVLEGRDVGTVVFPNADIKIFMVADIAERAHRRQLEMIAAHQPTVDIAVLQDEINRRDDLDSHRAISPLKQADDAVLLDNSNLTIDEQVDFVYRLALERQALLEKTGALEGTV